MTRKTRTATQAFTRELILFFGFLLFGILVLPVLVYLVGQFVFGAYEGAGLGEFFSAVLGRLVAFDSYAWFLALSPYLCISILRLMTRGWRLAGARTG